jgi:hypothetical protein
LPSDERRRRRRRNNLRQWPACPHTAYQRPTGTGGEQTHKPLSGPACPDPVYSKSNPALPDFVPQNLIFAGVCVKRNEKAVTPSQQHYIEKLTELPSDCSFEDFRSARARLAWACHTRPDACFAVRMASQTTSEKFCSKSVADLNDAIRSICNEQLDLIYPTLDTSTLRLTVCADSSYANCADLSSQIAVIVMLSDLEGKFVVLDYASKKSRRNVRSILGGEMLAFAEGFDRAFVIQHELSVMIGRMIPISMLTDSKGIFDVFVKKFIHSRMTIDDRCSGSKKGIRWQRDIGHRFYTVKEQPGRWHHETRIVSDFTRSDTHGTTYSPC